MTYHLLACSAQGLLHPKHSPLMHAYSRAGMLLCTWLIITALRLIGYARSAERHTSIIVSGHPLIRDHDLILIAWCRKYWRSKWSTATGPHLGSIRCYLDCFQFLRFVIFPNLGSFRTKRRSTYALGLFCVIWNRVPGPVLSCHRPCIAVRADSSAPPLPSFHHVRVIDVFCRDGNVF